MKKIFLFSLFSALLMFFPSCGPDNGLDENLPETPTDSLVVTPPDVPGGVEGDGTGDTTDENAGDTPEDNKPVIEEVGYKLYYTTTDAKALSFDNAVSYFGVEIVSNEYNNAQGVITFKSDIDSIGEYAFLECTNLKTVIIPNTVSKIGFGAFYNCSALESVKLPKSVKTIEHQAFINCLALKEVEIPEGVTTIGAMAFSGCQALESVAIPTTLKSVGDGAFLGCDAIINIYITNQDAWSKIEWGEYANPKELNEGVVVGAKG